jgi:hypothetical protein
MNGGGPNNSSGRPTCAFAGIGSSRQTLSSASRRGDADQMTRRFQRPPQVPGISDGSTNVSGLAARARQTVGGDPQSPGFSSNRLGPACDAAAPAARRPSTGKPGLPNRKAAGRRRAAYGRRHDALAVTEASRRGAPRKPSMPWLLLSRPPWRGSAGGLRAKTASARLERSSQPRLTYQTCRRRRRREKNLLTVARASPRYTRSPWIAAPHHSRPVHCNQSPCADFRLEPSGRISTLGGGFGGGGGGQATVFSSAFPSAIGSSVSAGGSSVGGRFVVAPVAPGAVGGFPQTFRRRQLGAQVGVKVGVGDRVGVGVGVGTSEMRSRRGVQMVLRELRPRIRPIPVGRNAERSPKALQRRRCRQPAFAKQSTTNSRSKVEDEPPTVPA